MTEIKSFRLRNISKTIVGHININSISSKFEQLKELVLKHVDILVVTETKLDDTFPNSQFHMDGFSSPYRLDRNRNGGGLMIFVKEDIPNKLLIKHNFPDDIEDLFIELNFRKSKWVLFGTYRPPAQSDQYFFNCVDKALDTYSKYDNFLLAGDFNAEEHEPCLSTFLYQHDLYNLVKVSTCFKNPSKPTSIDLFLSNKNTHFQNTTALCCGLSDFHKLVLTVLKTSFDKNKPREIMYRNFKNFNSESFNNDLHNILSEKQMKTCEEFEDTFLSVLNTHAPLKKKLLRANHSQYVTKALRKAIMRRSTLEKNYFRKRTSESLKVYKKQKNYCSKLYKRERRKFFDSLNTSVVSDNKTFWKVIKPFFTNKGSLGGSIKLIEKGEILSDDSKIAEELNLFFSNAVKSLSIAENIYITNKVPDEVVDPVDRAVEKFKTHPSVLIIKNKILQENRLSFTEVSKSEIEKELKNLNVKKATTHNSIPPKVLKASALVTAETLQQLFNDALNTGEFPSNLKKC